MRQDGLMARGTREADRLVVGRVGGIIAPAIFRLDVARGQARRDVRHTVGAIEQAAERKAPDRCPAVAFALVGDKTGAAERAGKYPITEPRNAARLAAPCFDDQVHGQKSEVRSQNQGNASYSV